KLLAEILAELPDEALVTETIEEGTTVSVKAGELKEHLTTLQAAAGLGEKLKDLGVEGTAALGVAALNVPVPPEAAGTPRVSVLLPAEAAQAISKADLTLVLKHPDLTLTIPSRSLKVLTDGRAEATTVEIALERVPVEGLALFAGARPLTSRAVAVNARALAADGGQEEPESFPENLTVALTWEEDQPNRESPDPSKLALYRRDEKGRWEYVEGQPEPQARIFRGRTSRLGLFLLTEYQLPFRDLEGHWAKEEVERLARRLVVRGMTADRFDPQGTLTRAQFVALMVRALGLPEEAAPAPVFGDLPEGHWARAAVEAAYRFGLVRGDDRRNFAPDRPLSREEMAVLLARALERYGRAEPANVSPEAALAPYRDQEAVSAWAREAVATAVAGGLLQGRTAGELAPHESSTRAEAAKVITDLLRLLGRI
ncbi:MAG: S-layer homology domain-containing protein, partial [Moorellales bacterium]